VVKDFPKIEKRDAKGSPVVPIYLGRTTAYVATGEAAALLTMRSLSRRCLIDPYLILKHVLENKA
jgi:hypothetical protein